MTKEDRMSRIPQSIWDQISTEGPALQLCEKNCQFLKRCTNQKKNTSSNHGRCSINGSTVYWGTSLCLHKK